MIELSQEQYKLLAWLSDDIHGVYGIPIHYCKEQLPDLSDDDEIPQRIRRDLERAMRKRYVQLFQNGWVDVFLVDLHDGGSEQLEGEEALRALQTPENYDWQKIDRSYVGIMTSPAGLEALAQNKSRYYRT